MHDVRSDHAHIQQDGIQQCGNAVTCKLYLAGPEEQRKFKEEQRKENDIVCRT